MNLEPILVKSDPQNKRIIDVTAGRIIEISAAKRVDPCDVKVLLSLSGGKDSSYAAAIARVVCDRTGAELCSYTFYQPGITMGVVANIEAITGRLEIQHEFRHFNRKVDPPFEDFRSDWIRLYGRLWDALNPMQRYLCVACNFGSHVAEISAIESSGADVLITGNPDSELEHFDEWIRKLQLELRDYVAIPAPSGRPMQDYYNIWSAIYNQLLRELFDECEIVDARKLYAPMIALGDSVVSRVEQLPVLGREVTRDINLRRERILKQLGWKLPEDIQGGTESDCSLTAAIAAVNIRNHGVSRHLKMLDEAADVFAPTPVMLNRARDWAVNGKSVEAGNTLLAGFDINLNVTARSRNSPVARALASKLFPIR